MEIGNDIPLDISSLPSSIVNSICQFTLNTLHYSFGVLDRIHRKWILPLAITEGEEETWMNCLVQETYSSQWKSLSSTETQEARTYPLYYKHEDEKTLLVIIPAEWSAVNEEKRYHEMGIGREIHFTLSTLMSLFFVSIDVETFIIKYATDNFLGEYHLSLSDHPSLLDICSYSQDKQRLRRIFKSVRRMNCFTLQFTFHSRNPKRPACCLRGYCVKVAMYADPIISFVDYTDEEQAFIIAECTQWILSNNHSNSYYLFTNCVQTVVWVTGQDIASIDWKGKQVEDILKEENDGCHSLRLGKYELRGRIRVSHPSERSQVIELIPDQTTVPSTSPNPTQFLCCSSCALCMTEEEKKWLVGEIVSREGTCFAVYRNTCIHPWKLIFSSMHLRAYLHTKRERMHSIRFQHTCSMEGRLLPHFVDYSNVHSSSDDMLLYLSPNEQAVLRNHCQIEFQSTTLGCTISKETETISSASTSEFIIMTIHCKAEYVDEIENGLPNSLVNEIIPFRFLLEELPYPILFLNKEGIICYQNEDAKSRFGECTSKSFTSILSSKSSILFHSIFSCSVGERSVNHLVYLLPSSQLLSPSTTAPIRTATASDNNNREYLLSLYHATSTTYHVLLQPIHESIILKHYLHQSISLLSDENTRFRSIFDVVFDGSCTIELQTMTILHPSFSLRTLLDCEERGTDLTQFIEKESLMQFMEKIKEVQMNGVTVVNEKVTLLIQNEKRFFSYIVVPISLAYHTYSQAVFCIKDIHQNEMLKLKENVLQQQVNSLNTLRRAMMDIAFNGTCLIDMESYTLLELIHSFDNKSVEQLLQLSSSSSSLQFREDVQKALLPYFQQLKSKQKLRNIRILIQRRKPFHCEFNMVYLEGEEKAMLSFRDITQDIEREERAIRLKVEAETANRNKRDFVVCHFNSFSLIGIYFSRSEKLSFSHQYGN